MLIRTHTHTHTHMIKKKVKHPNNEKNENKKHLQAFPFFVLFTNNGNKNRNIPVQKFSKLLYQIFP